MLNRGRGNISQQRQGDSAQQRHGSCTQQKQLCSTDTQGELCSTDTKRDMCSTEDTQGGTVINRGMSVTRSHPGAEYELDLHDCISTIRTRHTKCPSTYKPLHTLYVKGITTLML